MDLRIHWHIEGIPVGFAFPDRGALRRSGVHDPEHEAVWGRAETGAESLVIDGSAPAVRDLGSVILFAGADATRALARNVLRGYPLRVTRGDGATPFAPAEGFRYDGVYAVTDMWRQETSPGALAWHFRLDAIPGESWARADTDVAGDAHRPLHARWLGAGMLATPAGAHVKAVHEFHCQACGARLDTPLGPTAEAVHIQPAQLPHNGPDLIENVLCLCPSHAVLFRRGVLSLHDDLTLAGMDGALRTRPEHPLGERFVQYHRKHLMLGRNGETWA